MRDAREMRCLRWLNQSSVSNMRPLGYLQHRSGLSMSPMPRLCRTTQSVGCVGLGPVENPSYPSKWEEENERRLMWLVPLIPSCIPGWWCSTVIPAEQLSCVSFKSCPSFPALYAKLSHDARLCEEPGWENGQPFLVIRGQQPAIIL